MIRRIDHVNIATEDLAKTRDFFINVLGLEEGPRPNVSTQGHWLYADGWPLLHLQLSRSPVRPSRGSALNHVAFQVENLDAVAARLERHGIAYKIFQVPGAPFRQMQIEDPNGALVELNSPAPPVATDRPQPEDNPAA